MANLKVKNIEQDIVQTISDYIVERKGSTSGMLKEAQNVKKKKSKNILCKICNQKYFSRATLNLHINSVHEGERPFPCQLCEARFSQESTLKKHVASVHNKEKPYTTAPWGPKWPKMKMTKNHPRQSIICGGLSGKYLCQKSKKIKISRIFLRDIHQRRFW